MRTHGLEAPIVWLCGVRRAGKTTLARELGEERMLYMNCDLPEVEERVRRGRDEVDVIECKWSSAAFDSAALEVFRSHYPKGRNYLVSPSGAPGYTKQFGSHEVRVCTPSEFPVLPLS